MVTIRLNPAAFELGGKFYGKDEKYCVLSIDTGHFENWTGKLEPVYDAAHPSWRGNQSIFLIDRTGAQVTDIMFEALIKNEDLRCTFGSQILEFVARSLIIVERDNVAQTPTQIKNFTA
jgi:hypothetical protein